MMVEDRQTVRDGEDSWLAPTVLVFRSCIFSAPISVLSEGISMKLVISRQHVSSHCWKCFQGQRSKIKVTVGSRIFFAWRDISVLAGGISMKLAINIITQVALLQRFSRSEVN